MIWLSRLPEPRYLTCGACKHSATCVVHNGARVEESSSVRFFCAKHLRSYLEENPKHMEHLLNLLGTYNLYEFFEVKQ